MRGETGWGEGEGNQHRKDEVRPSNSANSGSTREQKGHAEKSIDGVDSVAGNLDRVLLHTSVLGKTQGC